jgi:tRNA pseudouridine38-40 synthase
LTPAPRHLRLDLAYDGTDFAGWQFQPNARTVQGVLEEVLARLQAERPLRVRGAGRTDAGVHARMQVADFDLCTKWDDGQLLHALSGMLPPDVRPHAVRTVGAGFNSRADARRKTYRYRLDLSRNGDPMLGRYALHHPRGLDRERVEEALSLLPGRRDWSAFAGTAGRTASGVRELFEARYEAVSDAEGWFRFTADGFLNHMVRNLVGTLLDVARGRFEPQRIERILASGDRRLAGRTAPAHGLYLWSVEY